MRIFLISATGLLGSKLYKSLVERGFDVMGTSRRGVEGLVRFDLERPDVDVIRAFNPDAIVISGAYTDVDGCEVDRMRCLLVNCLGVGEISKKFSSHIVYISTDYVFSGDRGWYSERDLPRPVQWYGVTKLCGEYAVMSSARRWTVFRPSTLFGAGGQKENFGMFVVRSLLKGISIKAFDDMFSTPTLANNLVEAVIEAIERELVGLYHFAGRDRVSRYEWALAIARLLGKESLVQRGSMSEARWSAQRPRDSSLSSQLADSVFKTSRLSLEESVYRFVRDLGL